MLHKIIMDKNKLYQKRLSKQNVNQFFEDPIQVNVTKGKLTKLIQFFRDFK